jgi:hypothetical protein
MQFLLRFFSVHISSFATTFQTGLNTCKYPPFHGLHIKITDLGYNVYMKTWDVKFSQQWVSRLQYSQICRYVVQWICTDRWLYLPSKLHGVSSQETVICIRICCLWFIYETTVRCIKILRAFTDQKLSTVWISKNTAQFMHHHLPHLQNN